MRRFAIVVVGLAFVWAAPAQTVTPEGAITVRVFSVQTIRELNFSPVGAGNAMRLCPGCAEKSIDTPATLKWASGALYVAGNLSAHREVEFRGAFRVRTGDAQAEAAAGRWIVNGDVTGLRILLTTSTERYVAAALNGEAAADEPLESLKAMAVVARSFALANAHRHATEGFDFCDSTHCQVLRFGTARPDVREAVQATTGETLWSGTHQAQAFATQHCGGEAEDAASVWPAIHAPYLHAHPDPYCLRRSAVLWHADIGLTQLTRILREQHWRVPAQIEAIHIAKRTPTGRAQTVEVLGQGARTEISASSLHFAIDRALGWNQIRSEWYEMTLNNGTVHFAGKGYGHGVGLCQAGSFEMASEGRSYREILNFYFAGTQVRVTANDNGWKQVSGSGWTLDTTGSSQSVVTAGDSAWARAQSLFPPRAAVHPLVRLMPSTELFRQATDEPGWMLAATRGTNIVLQPLPVLRAHGGEESVLLHEFLHVLVEQEATTQAPLWLREGLVEVLAGGDRDGSGGTMSVAEIESALARPQSAAESQAAHAASGRLVQRLIEKYGIQAVRGWLHSGVPPRVLN